MNSNEAKKKKNVLAFIPARGGSKGIPKKNIAPLAGRPLIAYTIEAAARAKGVDRVVVSTDSEEIRDIAGAFGAEVPCLRPKELSGDKSDLRSAVFHVMDFLEDTEGYTVDIMITLFVTFPFRSYRDVEYCLQDVKKGALLSLTVSSPISHPYRCFVPSNGNGSIRPLVPPHRMMEELSEGLAITMSNSSINVNPAYPKSIRDLHDFDLIRNGFNQYTAELVKSGEYSGEYLMHQVDTIRSLDIDTGYHLQFAEKIMAKGLFDFDRGFYE